MKKIISILLVAMLVIGMFPATALTAFAADGAWTLVKDVSDLSVGNKVIIVATNTNFAMSTTQNKNNRGQVAVTKSGDTVTFTTAVQELTLDTVHTAGNFTLSTGSGYLYAAGGTSTKNNYLKTNTTKTADCDWNITIASTGVATIKAAKSSIAKNWLRHNSDNSLFSCYSSGQAEICLYKWVETGSGTPKCEHTETVAIGVAKDPTCTEPGITAGKKCANTECGEIVEKQEEIPATGHSYEDGFCTECGEEMPQITEETYTISNFTAGTQYAKNEEHKLSDVVTMYTTQCHFTSELRIYSSSTHNGYAEIKSGLHIISIAFNAGNKADTLNVYGRNDDSSEWTLIKGVAVASTYTDYTVTVPNYKQLKLDVAGDQQVRVKSIKLTFAAGSSPEPECTHENTTAVNALTPGCTTAGKEADTFCNDCEKTIATGESILPGHTFANGACSVCGEKEPVLVDTVVAGAAYKMGLVQGNVSPVNVYYLNGGMSSYYMATVGVYSDGLNVYLEETEGGYYLYHKADGVKKYINMVVDGNYINGKYEDEAATVYTFDATAHTLVATVNDTTYWFGTNKNQTYTTVGPVKTEYNDFVAKLYVGDGVNETPVVEMGGEEYTSFEAAYEEDPNALITLLADVENIVVTGDLYLDLNGKTASVTNAKGIYISDSTATKTTAGAGKLIVEAANKIVTDYTVDGTRYIALKESAARSTTTTYTAHVLELNLIKVTLRTRQAGIYYKAKMVCDEQLSAAVVKYGTVLSLNNMPGVDFETENDGNCWTMIDGRPVSGEEFTSCSVFDIFVGGNDDAVRGATKIYANAYLTLNTGDVIMADTTAGDKAFNDDATKNEEFDGIACSLKDVMVMLNSQFNSLDESDEKQAAQKATILKFYKDWIDAMSGWGLNNIDAAAATAY